MNAKKSKLIRRHAVKFGLNYKAGKKAFVYSSRDTRDELTNLFKAELELPVK